MTWKLRVTLAVLRYNYTLSCSLKFVQHLKHFEHLVSVLGQATEVTTDYLIFLKEQKPSSANISRF